MAENQKEWVNARNALVSAVTELGFPEELGAEIAKSLGSPKAMYRMTAYLHYEKPKRAELIVDEMLAIQSEIKAWREKKAAQEANSLYNELLYYGLDGNDGN